TTQRRPWLTLDVDTVAPRFDNRNMVRRTAIVIASLMLSACGAAARLAFPDGTGAQPNIPPPHHSVLPTVNVVKARGWPAEAKPIAAGGLTVTPFARGLDHPRWMYVLPNGDVLVAETNAPKRPDDNKGIKGWFFDRFQKEAGGGVPSPNRITLLRDSESDGIAETRSVFASGLNSPFGMALVGDTLYIANTDAIVRVAYTAGATTAPGEPAVVASLPGGTLNHHWTKNVIASADGSALYASIGSNSNVAENGIDKEAERAAIWQIDPRSGSHRVFASGLRNPVGMAWVPDSGALWVAVNERDELGSDLVPDYMTAVRDGAFYGWPYCY